MITLYFFYDDILPFPYNLTPREKAFLNNLEAIRFVGDHDYPPFSYTQNNKKLGYEADLVRFLHDKFAGFDINITYEQKEWESVKQSAINKESDVITGIAITESRKKYFAFTKPYAEIVFASVCAKNSSPVKTIEDVKHRKIIVQKGSASEELLLKNNIKPAVLVTDNSDALEFLLSNIDDNSLCWVIGYPAAVKIVKENNADDLLNIVRLTDTDMQYAMAVHKDNEILRDILNKALKSLYLDGTFRYLDNTYFGLSPC